MNNPIPTRYNKIWFRSRNEANWSCFFDQLGIAHRYEPVMFQGGPECDIPYKPDFYFPEYQLYAEVKSSDLALKDEKFRLKIAGCIEETELYRGLLLLGNFPWDVKTPNNRIKIKWLWGHEGVNCSDAYIDASINYLSWGETEYKGIITTTINNSSYASYDIPEGAKFPPFLEEGNIPAEIINAVHGIVLKENS